MAGVAAEPGDFSRDVLCDPIELVLELDVAAGVRVDNRTDAVAAKRWRGCVSGRGRAVMSAQISFTCRSRFSRFCGRTKSSKIVPATILSLRASSAAPTRTTSSGM